MTPQLTGALFSAYDARDRDFAFHRSELFAGAARPAADVDVMDLHTWRIQGANSCVAYTRVAQVQALALAQGAPLAELSAELDYAGSRILAGVQQDGVGLPDWGSSYRLNLKWGRDRGGKAERLYPDTAANHNRIPPAHVWQEAPLYRLGTCRRILGEGNAARLRLELPTALRLARDGKCSIPGSVMPVDDAYGALAEGDTYTAKGGNIWGYHAQAIGAFSASRDAVAMLSSWSRRIYWVGIEWLALFGGEFWIVENIVRPS